MKDQLCPGHKRRNRGRGHWGHVPPRFCNKQRSALFNLENAPFFLRKSALEAPWPPKFEMLPTSLALEHNVAFALFEFLLFCNLYHFLFEASCILACTKFSLKV